ncbi:MAG: hypothetical protein GYB38_14725 [Gammaproteobacteria bacterium]|nr:hypothetical protein [Gammaproteobacteria bacterium]
MGKANNMLFYTAYFRIQELGAHYQQRMRVYSKPGVKNAHDLSRLRQGFVDSAHAIVDIAHACFCTSPYMADEYKLFYYQKLIGEKCASAMEEICALLKMLCVEMED